MNTNNTTNSRASDALSMHEENEDNVLNKELHQAMDKFYKLKNQYEMQVKTLKDRVLKNTTLSKREKQDAFREIAGKSKCVNCERPGGTKFTEVFDKEKEGRVLSARCGVKMDPCPLHIEIDVGNIISIDEDLNRTQAEINKKKQDIICIKNDVLFGYKTADSVVSVFDELKEELKDLTETYEIMLETYVSIYENPGVKEEEDRLRVEIYNDVQSIKSMMREYSREKVVQYAHDAVTLQLSQLAPKVQALRALVYTNTFTSSLVEDRTNICTLHQQKTGIKARELDLSLSGTSVVSMITGTNAPPAPRSTEKGPRKRRTNAPVVEEKIGEDSDNDSDNGVVELDANKVEIADKDVSLDEDIIDLDSTDLE